MTAEKKTSSKQDAADKAGCLLTVASVIWLIGGPMLMLLVLMGKVLSRRGWLTALDGVFFLLLAATVACRWIDQRSGFAVTRDGEPSTWDHFRRYLRTIVPTAVAAWVVANVVGNHLLGG
jgi:hypothetical protein